MDEAMTKKEVNDLHQQYLENGGTHSQVNILEFVRIIGGIDKILNQYLTNESLSLSTRRLEHLYDLLWSLTNERIQGKEDSELIPDDLIRYTFNENHTYLHHFYGQSVADKMINILNHKIIIFILISSILTWIAIAIIYGNTIIYPIYAIPIAGCIWMPFTMIWLLFANISAIKLITKTFEFWFKLAYIIVFVVSYEIDWWSFQNISLKYMWILYGIICIVVIFSLSILDAYNIKRIYKLSMTTLVAIMLSVLSILCQFTMQCGSETIISLTSIQHSATWILAIFLWKQAILIMVRKDKTMTMNYTPCVRWIKVRILSGRKKQKQ